MPSIGNFQVLAFRGRLFPAVPAIDVEDAAPGVDGHVASIGAWRAPISDIITTVDLPTFALVVQAVNGYRNIVGTSVTVVDQFDTTWSAVFVQTVQSEYSKIVTGSYRLTATWRLVPQSSIPP